MCFRACSRTSRFAQEQCAGLEYVEPPIVLTGVRVNGGQCFIRAWIFIVCHAQCGIGGGLSQGPCIIRPEKQSDLANTAFARVILAPVIHWMSGLFNRNHTGHAKWLQKGIGSCFILGDYVFLSCHCSSYKVSGRFIKESPPTFYIVGHSSYNFVRIMCKGQKWMARLQVRNFPLHETNLCWCKNNAESPPPICMPKGDVVVLLCIQL